MILNGVMAIILRYYAEFGSFRGQLGNYVKVVDWTLIFSQEMS